MFINRTDPVCIKCLHVFFFSFGVFWVGIFSLPLLLLWKIYSAVAYENVRMTGVKKKGNQTKLEADLFINLDRVGWSVCLIYISRLAQFLSAVFMEFQYQSSTIATVYSEFVVVAYFGVMPS